MKKTARTAMLLSSLVLLILGVILIVFPEKSLLFLCYAAGIAGVLYGIIRLIAEWTNSHNIGARPSCILSVMSLLIGILFVVKANKIVSLSCTLLGIVITFDALFKLEAALRLKRFGIKGWAVYLIVSLVFAVIGLAMIFDPFSGAKFVVIVSGAILAAEAIGWVWTVISLRGHFDAVDTDKAK